MKVLIIIELWDRRCLRLEAYSSIPGDGVVRVLEQLCLRGIYPKHLRSDNGPEFTGKSLDQWATSAGVQLMFIRGPAGRWRTGTWRASTISSAMNA